MHICIQQVMNIKAVIYYYSSTGNTESACRYIAEKIKSAEFELIDITACDNADLSSFDIAGFAFPTHYLGIPEAMRRFIENIKCNQIKPVFLVNTYGMMQGKALKLVNELLDKKGLRVIAWHALMMPESYPPFIAKGLTNNDKPGEKQINAFNKFINELSKRLDDVDKGYFPKKAKVKIGFLNSIIGVKSTDGIKKEMGDLKIDLSLCNQCGRCVEACYYNAISMDKKPVFNSNQCLGCWSCFNHCPKGAVYTEKIKSSNRYVIPRNSIFSRLSNGKKSGSISQ